ncbi:MAG: HPP family protein [Chloroflexi bacterium]|nr:HPP family protein [Chloroflexota bacterium]MDA1281802.1 HPP family protein [Chloroflexota bacterium]
MPSEPARSTNTQSHSKLRSLRHHPMLRWIDAKFVYRPRIYLVQSILAGVVLVGILIAEDALTNGAVVAAVASSVATVFFLPHSVASKPFRLIGGHVSAIAAALCTVGIMMLLPDAVAGNQLVIHALQGTSLALVILFMTVTNTEHAPAAGTALGLATSVPINSVIFIRSAAVIISIVRIALYRHLHNLI